MNDFPLKKFAKDKEDFRVKEKLDQQRKEEKKYPVKKILIPLGKDYNVQFVLWDNNLQIIKSRRKDS